MAKSSPDDVVACDTASDTVLRCLFSETLFESDVADPELDGTPRCPQCGLSDAEPVTAGDDDFVVRAGTKFR
ncbi:MAG TPA: hypothetical protein VNN08_14420 [Thermoanaerobaculia bacterium]|nr:hypothetical protein [Thermoanaerobaculia bacterium]